MQAVPRGQISFASCLALLIVTSNSVYKILRENPAPRFSVSHRPAFLPADPQSMPSIMSCIICNFVSSSFNDSNDGKCIFDLGSVEDIRHSSGACPSCRQIVDIYDQASTNKHTNAGLQLHAHRQHHILTLQVYWDDQSDDGCLVQGVKVLRTVGKQMYDLSKLDSPYIDLERPRRWLDICDKLHSGQCHHLPGWKTVNLLEELLLVDTEQGCLVQLSGVTKYFALSYLWGSMSEVLETKVSNVDDLKQKGAFTSKDFGPLIPQTIGTPSSLCVHLASVTSG